MSVHVGDIGTIFRVTIKDQDDAIVDVSSATTKEIILKPEGGTKKVFAASFVTDGTDGLIQYTTVSGDIDKGGRWMLQAYVVLSAGEWYSDIVSFDVLDNL